jgi:hypothetical protein
MVKLKPEHMGKFVFGELTEDGFASPESPFPKHYIKAKIERAREKVSALSIWLWFILICI